MNEVKSVKISAIISQVILALWLLITLMTYLFQGQIVNSGMDKSKNVFIFAHIPQLLAFAAAMTANFLMLNKKRSFRLAPVIISSVTTALLPLVNSFCISVQSVLTTRFCGPDDFVLLNRFFIVTNYLMYPLFAGLIIVLVSSAVYAYSKRDFNKLKRNDNI